MPKSLEIPVVERFVDEVLKVRKHALRGLQRKPEKRDRLWMSDLHPCTRFMYYSMAEGDKRPVADEYGQAFMESGVIWEDIIIRQLLTYNFQVVKSDKPIEIHYPNNGRVKKLRGKLMARGYIDTFAKYAGESIPVEIKSVGEHVYAGINSVEDLLKNEYTEKYLRQMLMYLKGEDAESGVFIINDRSGHWKLFIVYMGNHEAYVERLLHRMRDAFESVSSKREPDRIKYEKHLCRSCRFAHICTPEKVIKGGDVMDDPEIEKMLERHESIHKTQAEYRKLRMSLRDIFKGKEQVTVGKFIVYPSEIERKGNIPWSDVPPELKRKLEKYRRENSSSWTFTVVDVTSKDARPGRRGRR